MSASDRFVDSYREEAFEILGELETSLLELEKSPRDQNVVDRVFRALHTLKGSGAMVGFETVADLAHEVETLFDLVRKGRVVVNGEMISLTLWAVDTIRAMVDEASRDSGDTPGADKEAEKLVACVRALLPEGAGPAREVDLKPSSLSPSGEGDEVTYRIRFRPSPGIFSMGINPLSLLRELGRLGECRVVAQVDEVPALSELDPEVCYLYWDVILTTCRGLDAIRDIFIFVEDESSLLIDIIDDGGLLDNEGDYKRLGEILVERGDLLPEDLQGVLGKNSRIGEILIQKKLVDGVKVESALVEQQRVQGIRRSRQSAAAVSSIRVKSEKLDHLVDLIGELVTVQARLSQTSLSRNDPDLVSIAEEVERLTWALRDQVLNIRMLPIGTTFGNFRRMVRDLAAELGKEVELVTGGGETELDKTVLERLNDPLAHLIRNCIGHGIESPSERLEAGKPKAGRIHLSACHSGSNVQVQVRDDGKGLDRQAIREKAVASGLLAPEAEISEKDLFDLIFAPGFTTTAEVTNVSGRGVGMDVVRQAVDGLRATIDIASTPGRGTTFTFELPLTLAIIDGLLVNIGGGNFVLPLSAVEECIELRREESRKGSSRNLVYLRGELIPFIRLRERFRISGEEPEIEQIVIARFDNRRIGFVVDFVVGENQTVIKSLGRLYREVRGLSGATILGDGSVALILDLPQLVQMEEAEEEVRTETFARAGE